VSAIANAHRSLTATHQSANLCTLDITGIQISGEWCAPTHHPPQKWLLPGIMHRRTDAPSKVRNFAGIILNKNFFRHLVDQHTRAKNGERWQLVALKQHQAGYMSGTEWQLVVLNKYI